MDNNRLLFTLVILGTILCGVVISDMTDEEILNYLNQYGYAGESNPSPGIANLMVTNRTLATWAGCMMFQEKFNLTLTGNCRDSETSRLLEMPRCGNNDINNLEEMMTWDAMLSVRTPGEKRRRRKRFNLQGSRWVNRDLTYAITQYTQDLTREEVDRDIQLAFQVWADVTPLTFTRVNTNPDIEIRFTPREHGDGSPFDGPSGTLAHAFFPEFGGDSHFDEAEVWTVDTSAGINLFQVAAHEFGHALGLEHSDNENALMAPFYAGYIPVDTFQLHSDDIQGIQRLYGFPGMNMPSTDSPDQDDRQNNNFPDIPEGAPNVCNGVTFDAIFSYTFDGVLRTFAFSGSYFMEIDDRGLVEGYPREIAGSFDLITSVDAALMFNRGYVLNDESYDLDVYSYLFVGENYYTLEGARIRGPFSIQQDWGIPGGIDAAFQYSGNGATYFIKGDEYYRFSNVLQVRPDIGYPRPLAIWSEQFNRIDAAYQSHDRKTYFFSGNQYYRYNDSSFDVEDGYPRSISEGFLKCPSNDDGNTDSGNVASYSYYAILFGIGTMVIAIRLQILWF